MLEKIDKGGANSVGKDRFIQPIHVKTCEDLLLMPESASC